IHESTDDEVANDRQQTDEMNEIEDTTAIQIQSDTSGASLHHNPEASDDIMNNPEESINNYKDGEKHLDQKKARLNLPRSLKRKERMRYSSSKTESDVYQQISDFSEASLELEQFPKTIKAAPNF
ncbi:9826_t:CDS:2, partial [Racocetra persica]